MNVHGLQLQPWTEYWIEQEHLSCIITMRNEKGQDKRRKHTQTAWSLFVLPMQEEKEEDENSKIVIIAVALFLKVLLAI